MTPPCGRRRERIAFAAVLALVLAVLGVSELTAKSDRAATAETEVDRDVAPAREHLANALLAIEKTCADAAALALGATADVADRNALFGMLEKIKLPEGAGLFLEDANGHDLAWTGATLDDSVFTAMPRSSDGTWFVRTPASRRLAVRRTRGSPREGVPVLAVCHMPFAESFPLRNRAPAPSSLETETARKFRVAEDLRVLPPESPDGDPLTSAFGGTMAKLDVRPLPATVWNEAVDADAARRRAAVLCVLTLLVAVAAWRETTALASRTADWTRAGVVVAARVLMGFFPVASAVDLGVLTDPARYNHALPLDLAGSPAALALTCGALCLAAACIRRAAMHGQGHGGSRPGPLGRTVALTAAAALVCRVGLAALVHDVVSNSTVAFFASDTVFPRAAPALLLASLLTAGIASVLVVEAVWTSFPPRERPAGPRVIVLAAVLALVLTPLGPGVPQSALPALAAWTGFTAALASALLPASLVVRAAFIPLGAALALFAPLEAELTVQTRLAVEAEAKARVSRTVAAESLLVANALDDASDDPDLVAALRAASLPRDLALTLWSRSPLARRTGGSSFEIRPMAGIGEWRRFSADLPPDPWLPSPSLDPPPGEISREALPGRFGGTEGRWIVGEKDVMVDGRLAARLHIILEVRPPATALNELRILGSSRALDARGTPRLAVTVYGPDGALVETNDAYRPAGAPALNPELKRAALDERRDVWIVPQVPEADLDLYVRPDIEDGVVTGAHAFSYDTGGTRSMVLRGTRAALCGALVSIAALVLTARWWMRRTRLSLAQRLVVSYVLVAAVPLSLLGWANRQIALQNALETTRRELTVSIDLLRSALHEDPNLRELADLPPSPNKIRDLRTVAYEKGHHANLFLGPRLVATSDQGLFDTELLPSKLPGSVYRQVILLGQPFAQTEASVGGYRFDVGYAPWRSASEGEVIGAVSVPLVHRRLRDRELASAETAVYGLYLASLIAAIAIGTYLAGRLTKPLSDLTAAARRVARGDLEHPVPGAGPDELGEVVQAFNQMQHDLGESRARLVKAEKETAWRDMARQVAHEVKNPLTPMRLAAEHVRRAWRDKVPNFDEVLERGVALIVRQTESLQRIATAFSDFARFPNRRREAVDLAALVDESLDLWRDAPDLTIHRKIERPLPALQADPDELRRIVVNLAKNAVEAMEGRPGTLTVTLVRDGLDLVLTLADNGPGIPDDVLPRLFEPYLSTKTKGTGLGLAICKRGVEDLGGTISIESRTGEGTTVTVRLPVTTPVPVPES